MRPVYRHTLMWLPWVWLAGVGVLTYTAVTSAHGGGFIVLTPFLLLYGLAFAWLSRFQVTSVRLTDDRAEFVSAARVTAIPYVDLDEIAPARGVLQRRLATRFRGGERRVTVLSPAFPRFGELVTELRRRTPAGR